MVVELTAPGPVDVALLDALARLAVTARRGGGALHVRTEDARLYQLAVLTGLAEVIPFGSTFQP